MAQNAYMMARCQNLGLIAKKWAVPCPKFGIPPIRSCGSVQHERVALPLVRVANAPKSNQNQLF